MPTRWPSSSSSSVRGPRWPAGLISPATPSCPKDVQAATITDDYLGERHSSLRAQRPGPRRADARINGLVYVPSTGQVWISNETGRSETVVDATTGASVGTVPLGGEAGNVRYDARSDRVLVDVQTANVVAVIDPRSRRILSRASVPGCDHAHGLVLDPAGTRAFVACDGNARLVVLSLPDLRPLGHFPVGDAPDVLALDATRRLLYVSADPASSPPLTSTLHRGGSLDGPAWATTLTSLLSIRPRGRRSFLSSATRGRPRCLLPSPAEPAGAP